VSTGQQVLEDLTAGGTVAAAIVAALAVRQTGRQGRAQQQMLIEARERDAAERRADFDLQLLLELSQLLQESAQEFLGPGSLDRPAAIPRARALLLALPPDALPLLRHTVARRHGEKRHPTLLLIEGDGLATLRHGQKVLAEELAAAISSRRQLPPVSTPLATGRHRRP